ncbi:ribosomal-processing cysteine protease Prp [Cytobacillus sp. S13-E01]|uniref:ribosomal-processing cysteine protease Prp n=1 Tax=Cytobacillus sp. S13-E01 TaxID=3031326 RepID=UPI0023D7E4AD|nr:ribosomal-processing cysteine protease Prp [Cytobacillus sp. S13-E01]MDF0726776.1 ribosomal-processing cysteine protease Prp [Cytobacillus sp. S13-E01]
MIKVTIERLSNRLIESFTVSGHANFAEHGSDIVCAGVSAVSIGTINAIIALTNITPHIEQGGKGGFLRFVVPKELSEETDEKVQLLLEGMLISLQTIENDYGQYINITIK